MEGPPFSFTPERHWTAEKEKDLIEFFSMDDIKNKFKNLRTTFQRQYKMVKASEAGRSDDAFAPQWKHYEQLMFLQGCWDPDGGPEERPTSPRKEGRTAGSSLPLIDPRLPDVPTCSSASCVPPSAPGKCLWTEERERALIAFYSEHHCLWKKRSENHSNRLLRLRLLEAVRSRLSDDSAPFSIEDVKFKFKNLRTIFNREFKAVQASRGADKLHLSKWKHYQQLLFLCESCDEDEGPDDVKVPPPRVDQALDLKNHPPPSAQIKFGDPGGIEANGGAAYQDFLLASPGDLKQADPAAGATSGAPPSSPQQDAQPGTSPWPLRPPGSVQAGGKRSTDPRCHWSEAKVQRLISFYSEHSCLWNHRSENYKNRLLRQSQLEALSSMLSDDGSPPFSAEDIKTKFRNLRTIFQREHKALSGSQDPHLPKWKHYRQLVFLCERPEDPHAAPGLEPPPPPTPPASQHSPPPSPSPADSRVSGGRKRPCGEVLDAARTLGRSQAPAPHAGFLKYVEECLNETPADRVKKLKKMIIETIHSASEEA
ncbi:uncharacterized protein LOC120831625 isoform X2 [Gasterosteus aculeatus]